MLTLGFIATACALALLSIVLLLASLKSLKKGRIPYLYGPCMAILALTCLLMLISGMGLVGFQRLSHEENVGELAVELTAPQHYVIRLFIKNQPPQVFEINGDQWQLDARILKWKPWANLLGLHTQYRLERLSSRYANPKQASSNAPSIFTLYQQNIITPEVSTLANWLPAVDAHYGNSTYMPLGHGARYGVFITTSGIIARPLNQKAEDLVKNWR